jgi:hypothetical protein
MCNLSLYAGELLEVDLVFGHESPPLKVNTGQAGQI